MPYRSEKSQFLVVTVVMTIAVLIFSGVWSHALSLDELLDRIEKQFLRTKDFQASFVQETFLKSQGKTEREKGRLYFMKPRKMLWLYDKPKEKTLVVNSEKSWLYVPEDQVAYVQDTDRLLRSTATVRLLSGLGGIKKDFQVQFAASEQTDNREHYLLQLTPYDRNAGFTKAYIEINRTTYHINQVRFDDPYGNVTRVRLSNIQLNRQLKDQKFQFKPPPGVEIFQLP